MKKLLSGFLLIFTISSTTAAIASSINDNPWKLKSPVVITPAPHARFYRNIIFQGGGEELETYVKRWGIKVKIYYEYIINGETQIRGWSYDLGVGKLWGVCHEVKSGPFSPTVCVAVNSKGMALDPNIYRVDYRWNVDNN